MSLRTKNLEKLIPWILLLPEGTYFDAKDDGFEIQAYTRDQVRKVRRSFPGVIWRKIRVDAVGWWEYTADITPDVHVKIYADREGPISCKKVEKIITETISVPAREAHEETRTHKVITWECPEQEENVL